jgi:hypothetical protein
VTVAGNSLNCDHNSEWFEMAVSGFVGGDGVG